MRSRGGRDSPDARASAVKCHCQALHQLVGPKLEVPADAEVPDRGLAASSAQSESLTESLASATGTCLDDWNRSGKLVLVRRHHSGEGKPLQPPLVQTEGSLVVNGPMASRSHNHFTLPDQSRRFWFEDRHLDAWWSRPRTACGSLKELRRVADEKFFFAPHAPISSRSFVERWQLAVPLRVSN